MFIYFFPLLACNKGFFGKNCSKVCSPNCKTCKNTDGICSCKAGWMGLTCTKGIPKITNKISFIIEKTYFFIHETGYPENKKQLFFNDCKFKYYD